LFPSVTNQPVTVDIDEKEAIWNDRHPARVCQVAPGSLHCSSRDPLRSFAGDASCGGAGSAGFSNCFRHPRGTRRPAAGSPENAAAAARDPHSWINAALRGNHGVVFPGHTEADVDADGNRGGKKDREKESRHLHRDWAMSLAGGRVEQGEYPAKYGFSPNGTYSCTNDYVVYATGATPSSTQANVIAFNNLYTGTTSSSCPFGAQTPPTTDYTQPTVLFSYQAGTAGLIGSPVLSLDGTKVAFTEDGNPATLDVLTWVSGQGTSATAPATPGSGGSSLVRLSYTNTTVSGCTASSAQNSQSSPYVDYTNDAAYIGDQKGRLYRITGIFKGTPTLQYCITVNASASYLTSPVYDSVTNQVFISDGNTVYSFTPGATGFTASGSILVTSSSTFAGFRILSAPILDITNGFLYVFSPTDATSSHTIVAQLNLALTTQRVAQIGPSSTSFFTFDGAFDQAYFSSGPKSGAGTLYACGTQTGSSGGQQPGLYAMSFSSPNGLMNTTPAMSNNTNITGSSNPAQNWCSPVTTFYDGTNDRLFVGVGTDYNATAGSNIVTEWNINSRITSTSTLPNATGPATEWGGTSGFVIDNFSTAPQAASIYFSDLSTPSGSAPCGSGSYCAVKLTQAGLN
jgi:hypothetical protein